MAGVYDQCKVCKNSKFDKSCGIVCGLTMAKPTFKGNCPNIVADELLVRREQEKVVEEKKSNRGKWILTIISVLMSLLILGVKFCAKQSSHAKQEMETSKAMRKKFERPKTQFYQNQTMQCNYEYKLKE